MATPREINDLLQKLQGAYDQLGKTNPFANFDTSKIENAEETAQQLQAALSGVKSEINEITSDLDGVVSSFARTVDEIKNQNSALGSSTKAMKGMQSIAQKLSYDYAGISELSEKELKSLQTQYGQRKKDLELSQESLRAEINKLQTEEASQTEIDKRVMALQAVNNELEQEDSNLAFIDQKLKARIKQEEKINELQGLGGIALKGIQTTLGKIGLGGLSGRLGLDDAQKKMRKTSKEIAKAGGNTKDMGNKMKVLKAGMGALDIKGALLDPLTIATVLIGKFVESFKMLDKITGDTAKSLNITAEEAKELNSELNTIATLSMDSSLSTKKLNESLVAVGKSLGTNAALNEKDLKTFTKLREQAGFTNDELVEFQKLSEVNGKSLEDNTSEFLGQAKAMATTNGLVLNEKQLLKDVSKSSKAIQVSLGMSTKNLAEAVVAAKALGTDLGTVENISGKLLDFESSISAELEAELLTGKQINLEKAREAALNNDLATVAEEIQKQVGSAAEFGKMNRIQQEAFAQAVGMTREELSKTLVEQEALRNIGAESLEEAREKYDQLVETYGVEEARKRLGDEELGRQFEQQSMQERFQQSMVQLQELLTGLAEPVMEFMEPLMDIAEVVLPAISFILTPIVEGFKVLGELVKAFFKGLKEGQPIAIALAGILGTMLYPSIVSAITSIMGSFAKIPFGVGIPLGIAAVTGLFSLISKAGSKSKVPKAQFGANIEGGGSVMVGEVGPEVVDLPAGAKVKPLPVKQRNDLQAPQPAPSVDMTPVSNAMREMQTQNKQLASSLKNLQVVMYPSNLTAGQVTTEYQIQ